MSTRTFELIDSGKIHRLVLIGAFDRHNYGDLLFPLIIEHFARGAGYSGVVECFSTTRSDLSRFGGRSTASFRALFRRKLGSETFVIVAGGEVLSATWPAVIGNLCPNLVERLLIRVAGAAGFNKSARFLSRLIGSRSLLPFVYSPDQFGAGVSVAYNAVGGSHLAGEGSDMLEVVSTALRKADYISVRDYKTRRLLSQSGVENVRVSPDCAVLLSTLFPSDVLEMAAGESVRSILESCSHGYICFQCAASYVRGREDIIADRLRRLGETTGLKIVIFVIGAASGHNDQVAAAAIGRKLIDCNYATVIDTRNIFDIMLIISRSSAYVGTSLHGLITALSYGVPHVGLYAERIVKLYEFMESWCNPVFSATADHDNLVERVLGVLSAPGEEREQLSFRLKEKAMENFEQLFAVWK